MMSIIIKNIINWILEQYTPFNNILWNLVLIMVIGFFAYKGAFKIVGFQYEMGMIHGRIAGKIAHWGMRFFIVGCLMGLSSLGIALVRLILSIPWWVWIIIAVALVGILILWLLYKMEKSNGLK